MNRRLLNPGAFRTLAILAFLAVLAFLIEGYHPGLEDDAFYLAAIKKDLNPALFPNDSEFFQLQFQATIFDKLIAWSIRLSHLPLAWNLFLWQFASIFLILACCWRIACLCFQEAHERWAAVALVAALLTIPVTGVGISLVDQYLHPRTLATVAILAAIIATLDQRLLTAFLLLAAAAAIHVIMASLGVSLCVFLAWKPMPRASAVLATPVAPGLDIGSIVGGLAERPRALEHFISCFSGSGMSGWVFLAPLLLLWWFGRIALHNGSAVMARFATRLVWFGWFQLVVALIIMLPPRLERLRPLEPMRFLHLIYLFLFLLMGGLIGKYILRKQLYRWFL